MRKIGWILVCVILALTLCACGQQQEASADVSEPPATQRETEAAVSATETTAATPEPSFTFPEGSVLFGVEIGTMSPEDAYAAICAALESYSIKLTVNGRTATVTQSAIELTCEKEAFLRYAAELESGITPDAPPQLSLNRSLLRQKLSACYNISAKSASVYYNSNTDQFAVSGEKSGTSVDVDEVLELAESAIVKLEPSLSVKVSQSTVDPKITGEDPRIQAAVEKANAYLNVSLTYTYTPAKGEAGTQTLTVDELGSFIAFDDLEPYVKRSSVESYAEKMNNKFGVSGGKGKFKTTSGTYINLKVTYAGQPVDVDGLTDDIKYCVEQGISGTREAPYMDISVSQEMAYNGNYVEVDLSSQYLWVYKNGKCVVSTPIVSGCVYDGSRTPTGVYSIYSKVKGTYLVGKTYREYVDYWMAFHGNYGIHDASWRSSFGGDTYLYEGSHGCVNLPVSVAGSVYKNVSIGTKVILYGGASKANPVTQQLTGTESHRVSASAAPFLLDVENTYGSDIQLTYASDNTSVAEVAADGTVTVKGVGTANITVTAPEQKYYTSASMTVTVTVYDPCAENGHSYDQWTVTKAPTCAAGEETGTCSCCGATTTRSVAPVTTEHTYGTPQVTEPTCGADGTSTSTCIYCGHQITEAYGEATGNHDFSSGGQYCDNGCGAENPNYVPPTESTVETEATEEATE